MNNPQRELVDGVLGLACRPASDTGRFPSLVGNAVIEDDPLWRGYRTRLDIEPTTRGMTMSESPCICTTGPVAIHFGHCCFRAGTIDDYNLGQPMPCGHSMEV